MKLMTKQKIEIKNVESKKESTTNTIKVIYTDKNCKSCGNKKI